MANIKPYTDAIREAVYGEEVRGSIADAIDAMNEESSGAYSAAISAQSSAQNSATAAAGYANDASSAKTGAETAASNAQAAVSAANTAKTGAETAKSEAEAAVTAANNAKTGAETAASNAVTAAGVANTAKTGAETAKSDAEAAVTAANNAKTGAETAESNTRDLYNSLNGAGFLPMGTITFADIPLTPLYGWTYIVNEDFTSDSRFKDGGGHDYGAGSKIYYTADGYWDVMPGDLAGVEAISEEFVDSLFKNTSSSIDSYDGLSSVSNSSTPQG